MSKLRKIFTISVMAITVLSLSIVVAPDTNAAASAGDLIKMDGLSTVYYLGADGKRYVFPNETTYFSWYSDWSGVVTVPQSELETYLLGANVVIRSGTKLVKITTNPTVYAVEPNGVLRSIVSEENAANLYGANWTKRVVDVPDAFFTNYTIGDPLTVGAYPAGQLIKATDSADVYYVNAAGTISVFDSEASFLGNRFSFDDVVTTATDYVMPTAGDALALSDTIIDTSQGGGGGSGIQPGVGTGLTVALSADTAASGNVIAGQALANLASFNFTAANDGAVKVNTLKVKRIGISQDQTLSNVYLYEGNTRLTDSASVSSGIITWSNVAGLFEILAGTTKTITVKSDILLAGSGEIIGVAINATSDVITNGASVNGSFSVSGNQMSIVLGANLAGVVMGTALPSTADVSPGDTDVTVFKSSATITNHNVNLKHLRLREIGTISAGDLNNFNLYVGGNKVAGPVEMSSDMYVTFDLSASPVSIITGIKDIEVRADIVGGSSKTYSFSLRYAVDIIVEDAEYNVPVTTTGIPATTGTQTISSGSMTVAKESTSPSGNVIKDASSVTLAKYTLTAFGEPIKVETLTAKIASNNSSIGNLRNGKIMINGGQYGSTVNLTTAGMSFTVNYTVNPGTPATVEIVADIYDNDGTNNVSSTSTLTASLVTGANNGQAQTSLSFVNVPTSDTSGNQMAVAIGSLVMSKTGTYANQTTVISQTAYKLGAFTLTGNSSEAVNLNTISIDFSTGTTFTSADLTNVYVKYGATQTSIKPTVNATANTFSINKTLEKNSQLTVEVYTTIGSTINAGDAIKSTVTISGTTASSATPVSTGAIDGQTITVGTGSIAATLDASAATAKIVAGNSTGLDVAAFKFSTVYDNYTLTEVVATTTASGNTVIAEASLYNGNTLVSTGNINDTTITFPMSLAVAANSSKILTVKLALGGVGSGAGTSGANVQITLDSYKANNSAGVETQGTANVDGNSVYVYKTIPTISNVTLPSTSLGAGTQTLAKFTVAANATGALAWKKINFTVNKTAAEAITVGKVYDESNIEIAGTAIINTLGTGSTTGSIVFVADNEQLVSGSKTYVLKATIGGTIATGDNIQTSIAQPSSFAASDTYAIVAATTASFVWSDQSANSHSVTTSDWTNGYLVKNLPTDSQTLTK
ncbi:MAG: hypothetical protein ABH888_00885 [Patescibacteria group bacterium]